MERSSILAPVPNFFDSEIAPQESSHTKSNCVHSMLSNDVSQPEGVRKDDRFLCRFYVNVLLTTYPNKSKD